jgi:glycosyltransferase involved in cell wall biosynthesis
MAASSRPRSVVLMVRALDVGGTERQLAETAMALDRRLFQPWVACFDARGVRGDDLRRAGIPIVEFRVRSFARPTTGVLAWQFVRWLRVHRIALLHAFDYPTILFGVPLGRAAGVPVVLSSQRGDRALFPPAYRRALRFTDRLVDGIVVNSQYVRRLLTTRDGVAAGLVHTCGNGLDTATFTPLGPSHRPEQTVAGCVIGIVSAVRPEKSIETLLLAFSRLAGQHQLVIVGDGPSKASLQAQAAELGIVDRTTFVPTTSDVAAWYRGIDLFVLPSLNESFSNSLMEAMACGCCVVASNVGGNAELVRDGENGLLFAPGSVAGLLQQLETAVGNAALRHRLSAAGADTIAAGYTKEAAAGRLAALYQRLLAGDAVD